MYHGAEHKCINCIENGLILTPENVKNSSRFHKRCGTSFLFLVMFISIVFFIFIRVDNTVLQICIRVLLIPVIAGVSYEVIRLAGKSDGKLINIISKPGIWMQHLTTKEPDMDMIEVAIEAVDAVFDWKQFILDYYKDSENPFEELEAKENEAALTASLIDNKENTRTIKPKDLKKEIQDAHSQEVHIAVTGKGYMEDKIKSVYEESDDSESTEYDNETDSDDTLDEEDVLAGFEDDDAMDNTFINKDSYSHIYAVINEEDEKSQKDNNTDDNLSDGSETSNDDNEEDINDSENVNVSDVSEDGKDDVSDSGIEFIDDIEDDELTGDDIPLFKEKIDD